MKIQQFIKLIIAEYDNKLKTPAQIDTFEKNCHGLLKQYEGEILGFAYYEFVAQNLTRTSPTVGKIIKLCQSKQTKDHKTKNPVDKDTQQWRVNMKLVEEFKQTDSFKWAAWHMIGWDVLLFIERSGVAPSQNDIEKMQKAHELFKKDMQAMEDDIDITPARMAIYKMGKAVNQHNLDYFNERA